MSTIRGQEDIEEQASLLRQHLLAQLADTRKSLGLTKSELAQRCGLTRMTAQRAEGEDGNVSLATFLKMSVGLGLTPQLNSPASCEGAPSTVIEPLAENIVHRGYHHNRTKHNLDWADRRREAALARAWEAVNKTDQIGWSPVVEHLVPHCSQAQASAMATVVQWLGSDVGFQFLTNAMKDAGYSVIEEAASRLSKK